MFFIENRVALSDIPHPIIDINYRFLATRSMQM